jgi:hypothetical protein
MKGPLHDFTGPPCSERFTMATFIGIRSFANRIADLDQNQRRPRLDRGRLKSACVWALGASLSVLAVSLALPVGAQIAGTDASVAAASASVPNLVRWTGSAPEAAGRTVEMSFALYQDPAGGLRSGARRRRSRLGPMGGMPCCWEQRVRKDFRRHCFRPARRVD